MGIVSTNERDCRDCYRCVRTCAVKAVQVQDGHARVVDERCVLDGRCIKACPQRAKVVERGLERVQEYLRDGATVVASLAPSFPAAFAHQPAALADALRTLGFAEVEETAVGARLVALEHRRQVEAKGGPMITSSCPALLRLVTKYYPNATPFLAPIVSPMIAHARMLRAVHGPEVKVVFIGPCAAKKAEIQDPDVAGSVDVALSFQELEEWLTAEGLAASVNADAQELSEPEPARLFPIEGGLFRTAGLSTDLVDQKQLVISGFDECVEFLKGLPGSAAGYDLIEMLICPGGCLNGPLVTETFPSMQRRRRLLDYVDAVETALPHMHDYSAVTIDLSRAYSMEPLVGRLPSEQEMTEILARTGKTKPEDELNCGACGYESCREKAVAVFQGMAELEMCLPYMRRLAESKAARFIHQTPIGIVVVDRRMKVVLANPAWCELLGLPVPVPEDTQLQGLVSSTVFKRAFRTGVATVVERMHLPKRGRIVNLHVSPLPQEDVVVGVFIDVTTQEQQHAELLKVREETLQRTQEVVERQMRTAQEIAGLLGETTADTKALLAELMALVRASERPRTEP